MNCSSLRLIMAASALSVLAGCPRVPDVYTPGVPQQPVAPQPLTATTIYSKPEIAFTPFTLDEYRRAAGDASLTEDTVISLPYTKKNIRLKDLLSNLNHLEEGFNKIGYTLRAKETKPVTIAELRLNKTSPHAQRANPLDGDAKDRLEMSLLDRDDQPRYSANFLGFPPPRRPMRLLPAMPLAVLGSEPVEPVYDKYFGVRDFFGVGLKAGLGDAFMPEYYGNYGAFAVTAHIFGQELDLVDVFARSYTPVTEGDSRLRHVTAKAKIIGGMEGSQDTTDLDNPTLETAVAQSERDVATVKLYTQQLFIGPIPIYLQLGLRGTAGVRVYAFAGTQRGAIELGPTVGLAVYGNAMLGVGIGGLEIGLGVGGQLTILKGGPTFRSSYEGQWSGNDACVNWKKGFGLSASMLGGRLYVVAAVDGGALFERKEFRFDIFGWEGLDVSLPIEDFPQHQECRKYSPDRERMWCNDGWVNGSNDVNHCGSCGNACGAGIPCVEGRCNDGRDCFQRTTDEDVNDFAWSCKGEVPGMKCAAITSSGEGHGAWSDNYLCNSVTPFVWSPGQPLDDAKYWCLKIDEPNDPHGWGDNYLCVTRGGGYFKDKFVNNLWWSHKGKIPGKKCIRWYEPLDRPAWDDNYLCWTPKK